MYLLATNKEFVSITSFRLRHFTSFQSISSAYDADKREPGKQIIYFPPLPATGIRNQVFCSYCTSVVA